MRNVSCNLLPTAPILEAYTKGISATPNDYLLVSKLYPVFKQQLTEEGKTLPGYVQRKFEDYLKRRGFCPSCGARRMAEGSALLVDEVFPYPAGRQWVLSFPFQLRFLFAKV